jgi:hypothetical protein
MSEQMPEHNEIDCGFDVQQRQQQHAASAINIYPISYFQDSVMGIIFTDPDTKSWLEQNSNPVFGFPSVVRFSWATCKPYFTKGGVDIFWLASPISICPPDLVSCKYVGSDPMCLDCGPMVLIGLSVPLVVR